MIKFRDGVNVLNMLKENGYSVYRLRQEKLIGERALQKCRHGDLPSWHELDIILTLTGAAIGDILEHIPDSAPDQPREAAQDAQEGGHDGQQLQRPGTISRRPRKAARAASAPRSEAQAASSAPAPAAEDGPGPPDGRGPRPAAAPIGGEAAQDAQEGRHDGQQLQRPGMISRRPRKAARAASGHDLRPGGLFHAPRRGNAGRRQDILPRIGIDGHHNKLCDADTGGARGQLQAGFIALKDPDLQLFTRCGQVFLRCPILRRAIILWFAGHDKPPCYSLQEV